MSRLLRGGVNQAWMVVLLLGWVQLTGFVLAGLDVCRGKDCWGSVEAAEQLVTHDELPPVRQVDGRYVNTNGKGIEKSWWDLMRWYAQRARDGLPPPPTTLGPDGRFPLVKPDLTRLQAYAGGDARHGPSVTWLGHATALVQIGGLTVLTDPQWSERASPLSWLGPKRITPMPVALNELPRIDAVVISHNHYDHLDEATIRQLVTLNPAIEIFVPAGDEDLVRGWGASHVHGLAWWQAKEVKGVRFHCVPVHHWSTRTGWDRNRSLWGGWVLEAAEHRAIFVGDTGFSEDFAVIGKVMGPFDLALLPVGAYEPRWFLAEQHIDPPEAVAIAQALRARRAVGIHWGTFLMSDEAADAPIAAVREAVEQAAMNAEPSDPVRLNAPFFFMLQHGETVGFDGLRKSSLIEYREKHGS